VGTRIVRDITKPYPEAVYILTAGKYWPQSQRYVVTMIRIMLKKVLKIIARRHWKSDRNIFLVLVSLWLTSCITN